MKLYGDELAPNQVVVVNGRKIMADIKEVDTDNGWVDIFVPVVPEILKKEGVEEILDNLDSTQKLPIFEYETKRLTGKVEIATL